MNAEWISKNQKKTKVNILVFGMGQRYEKYCKPFFIENTGKINIVGFLDNNMSRQKTGKKTPVYSIDQIHLVEERFDGIVITSSKFKEEMIQQLRGQKINESMIIDLKTLQVFACRGKRISYDSDNGDVIGRKILIVAADMGFDGGTLAAVYAARALKEQGNRVTISAPYIEKELLDEILKDNICVTVWECLPYIYEEDYEWIMQFDYVIVNVFPMMNCAYTISKWRPVLWWIHEGRLVWELFYRDIQKEFQGIDRSDWMNRLYVAGVSKIAEDAFNHFYTGVIKSNLPFGIPDEADRRYEPLSVNGKRLVVAVIGGFSVNKGQEVFINAIKKMPSLYMDDIEIWFIGSGENAERELASMCEDIPYVRYCGILPHEKVIDLMPQIDIVCCPSLLETMSMAVVEGMMFGKICITTDQTGIAEYIENGINGFVVKSGDIKELSGCIQYILENRESFEELRRKARETYETLFSMEKFGIRLQEAIGMSKDIFLGNKISEST